MSRRSPASNDRSHGHSTPTVPLHAVIEPDQRRLLACQAMRQRRDRPHVEAGDRRDSFGRILGRDALPEQVGADCGPVEVIVVVQTVTP